MTGTRLTSPRLPTLVFALMVSILGWVFVAPPTAQMKAAAASVRAANAAWPYTAAPWELRVANAELADARKSMSGKNYEDARRQAEHAHAAARSALAKARSAAPPVDSAPHEKSAPEPFVPLDEASDPVRWPTPKTTASNCYRGGTASAAQDRCH